MKATIVILAGLFVLSACVNEQEQFNKLEVISTDFQGCLKSVSEVDTAYYQVYSTGDHTYRIDHMNASFNCCLPQGLAMEVSLQADTLFVRDYEKVPGNCRCMCSYNTSIALNLEQDGNYVLCFTTGEKKVGSLALFFDETLNELVYVSDLMN
ncbi:MAG: hypothetical protein JXR22_09460 [Prolixibacteraceae bacterium]|nr:hypothetical protein [Prolixibacteraceae bacterium]